MKLYPYQEVGRDFLAARRRAYLADVMGLGKSAQALTAAEKIGARRVLVVCPASIIDKWHAEAAAWHPASHFEAVSYASRFLHDGTIRPEDWDVVILDEAHYVKTLRAKRTRAALHLAANAPRAYLLSATPMPNHPGELYAPFKWLWPDMLEPAFRTKVRWFNHFCRYVNTQYGPKVVGVKNGSVLRGMIDQIMLRRTIEDAALDLPPLRVHLHLLPKDEKFARALREGGVDPDRLMEAMEGTEFASTARRLTGLYKAPRVARLLVEELDNREYKKIVVMYHHRDVGETLRKAFRPFGVAEIHGGTRVSERQREVDRFTTDDGTRVFLAQQQAAGEGLDLQVASEMVLLEPAWTPDANRQAIGRIRRIGSERPVRVRLFGVARTMDEAVVDAIARKTQFQEDVGLREESA